MHQYRMKKMELRIFSHLLHQEALRYILLLILSTVKIFFSQNLSWIMICVMFSGNKSKEMLQIFELSHLQMANSFNNAHSRLLFFNFKQQRKSTGAGMRLQQGPQLSSHACLHTCFRGYRICESWNQDSLWSQKWTSCICS